MSIYIVVIIMTITRITIIIMNIDSPMNISNIKFTHDCIITGVKYRSYAAIYIADPILDDTSDDASMYETCVTYAVAEHDENHVYDDSAADEDNNDMKKNKLGLSWAKLSSATY